MITTSALRFLISTIPLLQHFAIHQVFRSETSSHLPPVPPPITCPFNRPGANSKIPFPRRAHSSQSGSTSPLSWLDPLVALLHSQIRTRRQKLNRIDICRSRRICEESRQVEDTKRCRLERGCPRVERMEVAYEVGMGQGGVRVQLYHQGWDDERESKVFLVGMVGLPQVSVLLQVEVGRQSGDGTSMGYPLVECMAQRMMWGAFCLCISQFLNQQC
jgi:hypothetical protein